MRVQTGTRSRASIARSAVVDRGADPGAIVLGEPRHTYLRPLVSRMYRPRMNWGTYAATQASGLSAAAILLLGAAGCESFVPNPRVAEVDRASAACEQGDVAGCDASWFAWRDREDGYSLSDLIKKEGRRDLPRLYRACSKGIASACGALGFVIQCRSVAPSDLEALIRRDEGDDHLSEDQRELVRSVRMAASDMRDLLQGRAPRGPGPEAAEYATPVVSSSFDSGSLVPWFREERDGLDVAVAALRQECSTSKRPWACFQVAQASVCGLSARGSYNASHLESLETMCDQSVGVACAALSGAPCSGFRDLVPLDNLLDRSKMRAHARRACELGVGTGCAQFAVLEREDGADGERVSRVLYLGRSMGSSVAKRLAYAALSCGSGSSSGCARTAFLERFRKDRGDAETKERESAERDHAVAAKAATEERDRRHAREAEQARAAAAAGAKRQESEAAADAAAERARLKRVADAERVAADEAARRAQADARRASCVAAQKSACSGKCRGDTTCMNECVRSAPPCR